MAASEFEPVKWHVRTLLKDLDTAVKLSREQGSATPLSGLAAQLMRLHGSQGNLERDPATLVQMYRDGDQCRSPPLYRCCSPSCRLPNASSPPAPPVSMAWRSSFRTTFRPFSCKSTSCPPAR